MDVSQRQDRSAHRAHTSLPKINTANRSSTTGDLESPKHPHRHLTRRHHRHHTRDTIQSAIQLQHPFSFDSYNPLKRSHHNNNPSTTTNSSERQTSASDSQQQQQQQPPEHHFSPEVQNADVPKKRIIRPEHVTLERNRREARQEDVSAALAALSKDAHTATRKLDDTYYSLLEKLVSLKATLASLQQLSEQAKSSKDEFGQDAEALTSEVKGQVDGFGGYRTQERNVDDLVNRLKNGKEKAGKLEARLETCRGRLEKWERNQQEEQKLRNRTWAITWAVLATVLAIILTLVFWRKSRNQKGLYDVIKEQGQNLPDLGLKHLIKNKTAPSGLHLTDAKMEKQQANEEERWNRLLDEL